MLLSVRARLASFTILVALLAFPSSLLARTPTRAEMAAAVRRAESSPDLWATINICDTKRYPQVLGIRGQIPSLGFMASLYMTFDVQYWVVNAKQFKPVPRVQKSIKLGASQMGLHQNGVRFQFRPGAGDLRGSVTFAWRRAGQLLGQVTKTTTFGHRNVDYGDPPGHSWWNCVIK